MEELVIKTGLPVNHKGSWCPYDNGRFCQEGICSGCCVYQSIKTTVEKSAMIMDKCRKWETCHKKDMILDKDYDYMPLYTIVMRSVCKRCVENGENA